MKTKKPKIRRRWWQRVLRWSLAVALAATALYVTLPWWLPTEMLGERIAAALAEQTGADVRVGTIEASWERGLVIRGLEIDDPAGGTEPMVRVSTVRADLSPLTLLATGRLEWLELEGMELRLRQQADGEFNVAPLLEPSSMEIGRLGLRDAVVELSMPLLPQSLTLELPDVQLSEQPGQLGELTLTAALAQADASRASIVVRAWGGAPGRGGQAKLSFANLQLAQMGLEEILAVDSLGGRCRGSLELAMGDRGVVERFVVDVAAEELDVEPRGEPALEPIGEAGLTMRGRFDPIDGRLRLDELAVRLGGLDLTGSGELIDRWGSEPLEVLHHLELAGSLQPHRLAALIGVDLDELDWQGPLDVKLKLHRDGPRLALDLAADGSSAAIRRGASTLKPAGLELSASLQGTLDLRSRKLSAESADQGLRLAWGNNTVNVRGKVSDVDALGNELGRLMAGDTRAVARLAAGLDCRGSATISELEALESIAPQLAGVGLDGPLAASFSIEQVGPSSFWASVVAPEQTRLQVPGLLDKPVGVSLSLSANGRLGKGDVLVPHLDVDLLCGQGRLSLDDAVLTLAADGPVAAARIDAHELEQLLAVVKLPALAHVNVTGDMTGRCSWPASEAAPKVLDLDLTQAGIDAGSYFVKPAGEEWTLEAYRPDTAGRLVSRLSTPWATLGVEATPATGDHVAWARISDVAALTEHVPAASDLLGEGDAVSGSARIEISASPADDGQTLARVRVDFTDTELAIDNRRKDAGVAGQLEFAAVLGDERAVVSELVMILDETTIAARAERPVDVSMLARGTIGPWELADAKLRLSAVIDASPALPAAAPELAQWFAKYEFSGPVAVEAHLLRDEDQAHLTLELTADELAARVADPAGGADWLVKTPDAKARAQLDATLDRDGKATIRKCQLALPGGIVKLLNLDRPAPADPVTGKFQLEITDAALLARLSPAMAAFAPRGAVTARADAAAVPDKWLGMDHLELDFDDFSVELARPVALSGQVSAAKLHVPQGMALPQLGRIATDNLQWRIGESSGVLLADIGDLPAATRGRVEVLARFLDDRDVAALAGEPLQRRKLSTQEQASLRLRAAALLELARPYLTGADLTLRLDAHKLRTQDYVVDQLYDVRQFRLDASAREGQVKLAYRGGLEGGTIRNSYAFDLSDDEPVLKVQSELVDVVATDKMQPQLAMFFPGNTVSGTFNRDENTRVPLANAVAFMLDWRCPMRSAGEAVTVTTDGTIQGKGAPDFVTRIFPGLNLTTYQYERMTSFTRFAGDGNAENDMVFRGRSYDLYIEGTTDPHNIGRYEVGLILLGSPQSALWNHHYRQGRIPLLKLQARIEDGEMHDEEVSFLWPNESLFTIFLKNNIFYRLWLQRG